MTVRVTIRGLLTPGYSVQQDIFDLEHHSQVSLTEGVIYVRANTFSKEPLAIYPKENVQRVWFDYPKPEMQAGEEQVT